MYYLLWLKTVKAKSVVCICNLFHAFLLLTVFDIFHVPMQSLVSAIDFRISKLCATTPGSGLLWCRYSMEHSWSHLNSQGHRTRFSQREYGPKSLASFTDRSLYNNCKHGVAKEQRATLIQHVPFQHNKIIFFKCAFYCKLC